MTRLAGGRSTHLTADIIANESLRQFDEGRSNPSIRALAAALRASPAAIYHHFDSRDAIYQAAVLLVWDEAAAATLAHVPDLRGGEPTEVLVAIGLGTRRAWLDHFRLARYMTATPAVNTFTTSTLELMIALFEKLGVHGEDAALAFHSYASFMIGAVLFAAERRAANESLDARADHEPHPPRANRDGPLSIHTVMDLSDTDPARDGALFEQGLRRLVRSLTT